MADISKIKLPNSTEYNIKDPIARASVGYGQVDSTSTSTAFTAQIPGITEYYDGLTILLKNGVITSASGFTIDINGLGGKPSYSNMATGNSTTPTDPTRDTTIFNLNYTMLFVYSTTIVEGGGWICYRGYDANTNTIGYQLRTNTMQLAMSGALYAYRLVFTAANNYNWIPANSTNSTDANAQKTTNTAYFNPFGDIRYYSGTAEVASGSRPSATALWQQYVFNIGYSFNTTGAAPTLTTRRPVYLKCTPNNTAGTVRLSSTPYTQTLPTANDTHVYIFLGIATSATNVELLPYHPVYIFRDGVIQLWTGPSRPVLPNVTTTDDGKVLRVIDGVWDSTILTASDIGALPDSTSIPSNTSDLINDSGFLTDSTGVTSVNGLHGAVTFSALPSVVASDEGKILKVNNGIWSAQEETSYEAISTQIIDSILNGTYT